MRFPRVQVTATAPCFTTKNRFPGVETTLEVWPHLLHAWQGMVGLLPESAEALRRAAGFVDRVADGRIVGGAALRTGPDPAEAAPASLPRAPESRP
jgi:hypothetical protein